MIYNVMDALSLMLSNARFPLLYIAVCRTSLYLGSVRTLQETLIQMGDRFMYYSPWDRFYRVYMGHDTDWDLISHPTGTEHSATQGPRAAQRNVYLRTRPVVLNIRSLP